MHARRVSAVLLSLLALHATAGSAGADPADKVAIDRAVGWGKDFLQKQQKQTGFWGTGTGAGADKGWGVGYTALAGLTLVECGVPTTDPGLKRAAAAVRNNANDIAAPYELALAILFLDRMKDKSDKRYIQLFAGRLIAGQMPSGGWGYVTPKLHEEDAKQLLATLRKMAAPPAPAGPAAAAGPAPAGPAAPAAPPAQIAQAVPAAPAAAAADREKLRAKLPLQMRRLAVLFDPDPQLPPDAKDKAHDPYDATTDNSNTHFAMVGLLTARKYDVPTERSFARVARRFRTTQGGSGTWAYPFVRGGADGSSAMTCIALVGVAVGHAFAPEAGVRPETDPVIVNAFVALNRSVGEPAGTTADRPKVKDVGGLYFLWTMERIAVLYDLQKLGNKDWYLWGAEILLSNQLGDGSWADDGGFHGQTPIVNTCLALLFLKRANLTPDLSKRLTVDPSVLTAKVVEKVSPKVYQLAPPPHAYPPPVASAPMPHAAPKPPAPVVAQAPPPAPEPVAATPVKKTPWLWIVLGTVLAALVGGWLAFLLVKRRKRDEEDDEEADGGARKKKGKKKVRVKAEG